MERTKLNRENETKFRATYWWISEWCNVVIADVKRLIVVIIKTHSFLFCIRRWMARHSLLLLNFKFIANHIAFILLSHLNKISFFLYLSLSFPLLPLLFLWLIFIYHFSQFFTSTFVVSFVSVKSVNEDNKMKTPKQIIPVDGNDECFWIIWNDT